MERDIKKQESALQQIDDGFTAVSWSPSGEISYEEWERLGYVLQRMDQSLPWWLGDWLNYGEYAWGESYAQALEITGKSIDVLQNYKWVANKVPLEVRREWLSWSHHRVVSVFPVSTQDDWLSDVENNDWSVTQLQREIQLKNISILPPEVTNPTENEERGHLENESMPVISPVRRLRYALKMLIERHLEVAPYDNEHNVIVTAERIHMDTQHEENEDLDDD